MSASDPPLTPGQARILAAVRERSPRVFDGRAIPQVERLESLGLVTVDWDMDLTVRGKGTGTRWRLTVAAVPRAGGPE